MRIVDPELYVLNLHGLYKFKITNDEMKYGEGLGNPGGYISNFINGFRPKLNGSFITSRFELNLENNVIPLVQDIRISIIPILKKSKKWI